MRIIVMHRIRDVRSLVRLHVVAGGLCVLHHGDVFRLRRVPGCCSWRVKLRCPEREAPEASQQQRIGGRCLAGEREPPLPTHGPDTYLRKRTSSWGHGWCLACAQHDIYDRLRRLPAADAELLHPS